MDVRFTPESGHVQCLLRADDIHNDGGLAGQINRIS
jgi:hypothetical protein